MYILKLGSRSYFLDFVSCCRMSKEIVVSGIRSTGFLHLGNYFGDIRNYVKMQENYDCYFFVADYHSLTTHPDPKDLKANVFRVAAENIASGLDPEKVALYAQSDIPEIPELYLMLNMMAYKGELEKVPTFKDKVRSQPENVNAGLLTYPVLMSADILIHRAVKVPVGKDQEQHVEMARNFAQRFNNRYGECFPLPYPFNFGETLVKVPSLDGAGKMSKSENVNSTLYLADEDDVIRKKIMKAKTDAGPCEHNSEMPDYIQNIFQLMSLVSASETVDTYKKAYNTCTIRYGDMKKQIAEDMVTFIRPIREKAVALQTDEDRLRRILKDGAEKARQSASKTIAEARKLIGIHYY
ncbi:MAG: tryptophan--tRNA ligase [Bacteroidota bacterium]